MDDDFDRKMKEVSREVYGLIRSNFDLDRPEYESQYVGIIQGEIKEILEREAAIELDKVYVQPGENVYHRSKNNGPHKGEFPKAVDIVLARERADLLPCRSCFKERTENWSTVVEKYRESL